MNNRSRDFTGFEVLLLMVALAFTPMAQAQRTEVSNDPDGRLHFTQKNLPTHLGLEDHGNARTLDATTRLERFACAEGRVKV